MEFALAHYTENRRDFVHVFHVGKTEKDLIDETQHTHAKTMFAVRL